LATGTVPVSATGKKVPALATGTVRVTELESRYPP
jgi:hypothetical protein